MASFTLSNFGVEVLDDNLNVSDTIVNDTEVSPVTVNELVSFDGSDSLAWGSNIPIAMVNNSYELSEYNSMRRDYYYRVHVTPAILEFGPVLSDVNDTFIAWNAWLDPINCLSLTENGASEFNLDDNTAPYELLALEYKTYTVTVPKEGAADIASSIDFVFDTGEERTVLITGIRLAIFYFPYNKDVKEMYSWNTKIIKSKNGTEQRINNCIVPRQTVAVNVPLQTTKIQNRFEALMFGWSKKYFGLPLRFEQVLHTATINTDDLVITLDTTFADFRDDSYAIIYQDTNNFEVVKIETKTDTDLTLESGVVGTYTGNKWIAPVRITQVSGLVKKQNPVTNIAIVQVSFAVKDNILITGYSPEETYIDMPVITEASKQFGGKAKESSIDPDMFLQDSPGDFDYISDSEFNINIQGWGFVNETKEAMWRYKQFLHYLCGRQKTICIPGFRNDLVQTETIGAADTSFRIENIKLAENMGLNDLRTHLVFIFPSGTILCREITGIVEADEDEEIISIDTDLGLEVEAGDCRIAFLDISRLAGDSVEINHIIPYKNYSNVSFLAVKE